MGRIRRCAQRDEQGVSLQDPGGRLHAAGLGVECSDVGPDDVEAVRSLPDPLDVVSDSTYVVNCFRDRWWEGWLARGWLNSARKPVANRDLWEPLVEIVRQRGDVAFRWVKGHGEDRMNDLVDRLAVEAARVQRGRSGEGWPADLGPADPGPAPATVLDDPRAPAGRRLAVVGHKPPAIGGYGDNPTADALRLVEVLAAKRKTAPDLVVLGLGLGAEQLGAEAALLAGVRFVAVLPYPDPDAPWPAASRRRHRELLAAAQATVVLSPTPPQTKQKAEAALARRNGWLVRHADEAVAVWDGRDPEVGQLVRSLIEREGEEEVWILDPGEVTPRERGCCGGGGRVSRRCGWSRHPCRR